MRHYKAVPFGIPAYAGMTVGRAGMTVAGRRPDSRLRGNDDSLTAIPLAQYWYQYSPLPALVLQ